MTYSIAWKLWDVPIDDSHLVQWQADLVRDTAAKLVSIVDAAPTREGNLRGLLPQEVRDWVLRGGERFIPLPDVTLDLYWKAHRGLPGFYDPLLLGVESTKYLGVGSAGDIGEGLALAVMEAPHHGLGQVAFCRPLGAAPDFLCCDPTNPAIRPIVEVKATEASNTKGPLVEATRTLLDIYRAWQRHRPLGLTPGYAVAVKLAPEGVEIRIVRLHFRGKEFVDAQTEAPLDVLAMIDARKLLWAGANDEATKALAQVLKGRTPREIDLELATLLELQGSAAVAATLEDEAETWSNKPKQKGLKGRSAHLDLLDHMKAQQRAESLLKTVEKHRGTSGDRDGRPRRRSDKQTPGAPWVAIVQNRADGLEVRGCVRGNRRLEAEHLGRVAEAVLGKAFRRLKRGFDAAACWLDGVEWTLFCDGRLQGWLPAVENPEEEEGRLLHEASIMLTRWESILNERR